MTTTPKKQAPSTRSIELEVEVPGTPEQVWQAIATGPGITAWFLPTEVVEREGGAISFRVTAVMESTGVVTAWEPPRRFAYEEKDWAEGAPPLATELLVEARAGGTCVVRLVTSLFTSSDDWDDQLETMKDGWPPFLRLLQLYLAHFAGQRASILCVTGNAPGPKDRAWAAMKSALGLAGAAEGERRSASGGAPVLAGQVDRVGDRDLVLRIDQPAPGFALAGVYALDERVHTSLTLYLFGDQAPEVIARDEPEWRAWMEAHFPPIPPAAPTQERA